MGVIRIEKYDVTFIHIPRTGGQSVRELIRTVPTATISSLKGSDINIKHPDIKRAKEIFGDLGWTFCTVRNPYNRFTSMYSHLIRCNWMPQNTSIEKYTYELADYETFAKPMSKWFTDGDIDYIIRFENLRKDFQTVADKLEISNTLPHINQGRIKNHKTLLTDEIKDFVYKKYEEDFERFGYER